MSTGEQRYALPGLDALRGMRLWTVRDALASVFWAITEGAYRTGYALHLGASDALIGLLSAAPSWAQSLQMVSPLFIERLKRRKPLSLAAFGLSYAMWLPIALIPFIFVEQARPWAMIILVGLAGAAVATASPATTSWFTDVVPGDVRGRFVGRLYTIVAGVGLAATLAAGRYMDLFPAARKQTGFVSLFIVGVAFSMAAIAVWAWVPEPPKRRSRPGSVGAFLALPFRHANFRSFTLFACGRATAIMVAAPFFTVYMLKTLQMSYAEIAIFSAVSTISAMATNPMWGHLADKFGHRPILRITSFSISLIPLLWFFVTKHNYRFVLPAVQVWAGTMSAGVMLSQFNLMVKIAPEENRSVYVGAYSALASGASAIGAMIGGALAGLFWGLGDLEWWGHPVTHIQCVFLVSALLRQGALPLLDRVHEEEEVPARVVMQQVRRGRPLMTFWNLLRMARSSDPARKAEAAEALGGTRSPLAVGELIGLLDDSDREVRRKAARALGEIGDPRALQPLIQRVHYPFADIVEEAVEALGRIPAPESQAALLELLNDGRPAARKSAALALGVMGDPRAQQALEELLARECDATVFLATAQALSRLGSARALHRLRVVLRRSNPGLVRKQAANSIGHLLGRSGQFYSLLQAQEMRQQELAARILARARRRLRTRIPGGDQDRRYVRRCLDAALGHFARGEYGRAVSCLRQVASRATRRLAAGTWTDALVAGQSRAGLGDLTAKQRVGLVLQTSNHLRVNFGFLSGLQHDGRRRELYLEEALLGVFAFGQIVEELRRVAREWEATIEGVDRYRGDGSEYA